MAAADLHKEEDSSLNFFEIEQPTPVPDGQNRDGAVVFQTVDDAVLPMKQLTNVVSAYLGHDSTSLGEPRQSFDEVKDVYDPALRCLGPVKGDVLGDLSYLRQRERRPVIFIA
jgi:hypothetical protein